ncbi:MAG TPA: hypothetical protein VEC57_12300 [Candidatus Limnocylindrales bacterium]|nr:hypothetical protein [Candidatus Limnocylindrales bacterium]
MRTHAPPAISRAARAPSCTRAGKAARALPAAACVAVLTALLSGCATSALQLSPLPVEQVHPLEGKHCSCVVFRRDKALTPRNVLFTTGPYDGPARLRLRDQTVELRRKGSPEGTDPVRNTYSNDTVTVVTLSRQVPYESCADYPTPPTQGSCFTGTLTVRQGADHLSIPMVQICGC